MNKSDRLEKKQDNHASDRPASEEKKQPTPDSTYSAAEVTNINRKGNGMEMIRLQEAIATFLLYQSAAVLTDADGKEVLGKNNVASTVNWHRRMLRQFRRYIESRDDMDNDPWLSDLTVSLLNDYKSSSSVMLKTTTVNARLRSVKTMLNAMVTLGYLLYSPAQGVKFTRVQQKSPKGHPRELVLLLREVSLTMSTRVALVVHLLTETGARASEIAHLRWHDIEISQQGRKMAGRATVRGKGDKTRKIFFYDQTCRLLQAWRSLRDGLVGYLLDHRSELTDDDNQVFWGLWGPLGYSGVYNDFKACVKQANVDLSARPLHGCRHGFAKDWLKNGGDLKSLQDALGHSVLSTTAIYLQLDEDELGEMHSKFSGFA